MKGISLALALSFLLVATSEAGWNWNKGHYQKAKANQVVQRITSPSYCFDTGFEFSGFATGVWPQDAGLGSGVGGGLALSYFFDRNLGLEFAYSANGSGTALQTGTGSLVYRIPLGGECCANIAPYFFGGAGVAAAGSNEFLWRAGGGLDFRFESWGCIGLFVDVSYNWVKDNIPDFIQGRAGIRVPF